MIELSSQASLSQELRLPLEQQHTMAMAGATLPATELLGINSMVPTARCGAAVIAPRVASWLIISVPASQCMMRPGLARISEERAAEGPEWRKHKVMVILNGHETRQSSLSISISS